MLYSKNPGGTDSVLAIYFTKIIMPGKSQFWEALQRTVIKKLLYSLMMFIKIHIQAHTTLTFLAPIKHINEEIFS